MTAVLATFQTAFFGRLSSYLVFRIFSGTVADSLGEKFPKILLYNINRGFFIFNAKNVLVHKNVTLQILR